MTAIPDVGALTEIAITDLPFDNSQGTAPKRRALVAIRYTSVAATNTIPLATYIPGISDIEGVVWNTMNSIEAGTAQTWSTTTLTVATHAGAGVGECGVIVNFS